MKDGADMAHLLGLYAAGDDPWDFRGSAYEAERLDAVARALRPHRLGAVLELGCGNGELARRIAPRAAGYTGLDAVPAALAAARRAVPGGRFREAFLPCALPPPPGGGAYDLVVLSEVLYFLAPRAIRAVAAAIDRGHPRCAVLAVTWRGPTGHRLDGERALAAFAGATRRRRRSVRLTRGYRIAAFGPLGRAQP